MLMAASAIWSGRTIIWRLASSGWSAGAPAFTPTFAAGAGSAGVQANIGGGGEFGPRWPDAGRYAGKRLTHDDFAAVAADLVRRGVTRPDRLCRAAGAMEEHTTSKMRATS